MYFNSGKGSLNPQDIRKAANFIVPNALTAGTLSTGAVAADRYYWYPLIVGNNDLVLTHIGVALSVAASAGKKGRAAIYSDCGNRVFEPYDLLYDCGEFAIDVTGFTGVNIHSTFGEYITLQRNTLYWVAFALEEAVTAYYKATATLLSICVAGSAISTPKTAWRASRAYATGFPSNATSVAALTDDAGYMLVGVL